MKYVGATDWFIRWPFLLEGVVLGCIGGCIAAVALRSFYAAMAAKIYSTLAFFPLMPQYPFMNYVTLAILLAGIVIGAIGSVISLKRFLRVLGRSVWHEGTIQQSRIPDARILSAARAGQPGGGTFR